jgi:5-hydroxyisourate hydrolase
VSEITTHVLDTAAGRPAAGVPVTLLARDGDGDWVVLDAAVTDADGRTVPLRGVTGPHRLAFDVAAHLGQDAFYPEVTVTFRLRGDAPLHVPLLLSPYGYTTYRGS